MVKIRQTFKGAAIRLTLYFIKKHDEKSENNGTTLDMLKENNWQIKIHYSAKKLLSNEGKKNSRQKLR